MEKITSGNFEQFCLCFSLDDICKIRENRLLPEHRKEVFLAKMAYFKFKKAIEQKEFNKAKKLFIEYTNFESKEWVKLYDFHVGIELINRWED